MNGRRSKSASGNLKAEESGIGHVFISSHFVMLHFPKTGSSFARKALEAAYEKRRKRTNDPRLAWREEPSPNIRVAGALHKKDQHGCFCQIPTEDLHKPIFSIVRHPFDRLVSMFKYRYWASVTQVPPEVISERFPAFPALSLEEYRRFQNLSISYRLGFSLEQVCVGHQTVQFIQMFFREPRRVLEGLTDDYLDSVDFHQDMGDVTFLLTETLRSDLQSLLEGFGFSNPELEHIETLRRSNVSPALQTPAQLDASEMEAFCREERLLFRVFEARKSVIHTID